MSDCTLFFKSNGKIKIPKDFKLGPFRKIKCMLNRKLLIGTLFLNKNTSKYLKKKKQNKQKKQLLKKLKNKNIWYFTVDEHVKSYHFFYKSNIASVLKFILLLADIPYTDTDSVLKDKISLVKLYKEYYKWYLLYSSKFSARLNNNFFYEEYVRVYHRYLEHQFDIKLMDFYTHENLYIYLKKHTNFINQYYKSFVPLAKKYCLFTEKTFNNSIMLKDNLKKIKSAKKFNSISMGKYVIKNASKLNMNMFI